jgi:hypothetical protein
MKHPPAVDRPRAVQSNDAAVPMANGGRHGTIVIRSLRSPRTGARRTYAVTFSASEEYPAPSPYRCASDFALLRILEDLLPSPEQRLRTLEQIRDAQEVAVPNLVVPEPLLAKYGFAAGRESRARGRQVMAPRCVACSLPTTASNRFTTLSGEVFHSECRAGAEDVLEAATRILRRTPERTFCHTCLAGIFKIGVDDVRKLVGQLRLRTDMTLATGLCSVCSKHRITLSGSGSAVS